MSTKTVTQTIKLTPELLEALKNKPPAPNFRSLEEILGSQVWDTVETQYPVCDTTCDSV